MICKQCNRFNDPSNSFCVGCGNNLKGQQEQVVQQSFDNVHTVEAEQVVLQPNFDTLSQNGQIHEQKQDNFANSQDNICINCNTVNQQGHNFCIRCGFRLGASANNQIPVEQSSVICKSCNTQNDVKAQFCIKCGMSLTIVQRNQGYNDSQNFNNNSFVSNNRVINVQAKGNGMSVAGLILGIISLVVCWIGWLGILVPVLGITFSSIGLVQCSRSGLPTGKAKAGLICSIISLALIVIFLVFFVAVATSWANYGY